MSLPKVDLPFLVGYLGCHIQLREVLFEVLGTQSVSTFILNEGVRRTHRIEDNIRNTGGLCDLFSDWSNLGIILLDGSNCDRWEVARAWNSIYSFENVISGLTDITGQRPFGEEDTENTVFDVVRDSGRIATEFVHRDCDGSCAYCVVEGSFAVFAILLEERADATDKGRNVTIFAVSEMLNIDFEDEIDEAYSTIIFPGELDA